MNGFQIASRAIGPGHPTYIIAEMSANHEQSFDVACEIIRAIKDSGADAVKLQTYTADTMTMRSDRPEFQVGGGTLWDGRQLYDLYDEAHTPWEWQPKLKQLANDLGLDLFSSAFDSTAVDFLDQMDVPCYKIASFELTDLPLIEYAASKGKPIILSTGMGTQAEIAEATQAINAAGVPMALLKCTSAYPSPPQTMNLRTIPHLAETFGVPTGLSDHTLGIAVPVAAVALGACIVEKHFTMLRSHPGPDSAFSLEPDEFRTMVDAIRVAEQALGSVTFERSEPETSSVAYRRSLYFSKDLVAGECLTEDNVRSIRPGSGLPPACLKQILGKTVNKAVSRGTPVSWDVIS